MKKILLILIISSLYSCKKDVETKPTNPKVIAGKKITHT